MPKRVDSNQAEIVEALRKVGCSVQDLHEVGHGCPDLLVGLFFRGLWHENILMEVKSAKGKLNETEAAWHAGWRGQVAVVHSAEEALAAIGIIDATP